MIPEKHKVFKDIFSKSDLFVLLNMTKKLLFICQHIKISYTFKKETATNTFGLHADFPQFKIGFEKSSTIKWDESTSMTTYDNISASGWGMIEAYIFVKTGLLIPSPKLKPAY